MLAILRPRVHTPVSPGERSAGDAQRGQRGDEPGLELAQVPVEIFPVLAQVEDRISHELARPVVGHVAAALDLRDLEPAPLELRRGERQAARAGAAPQRDHRLVLHQEQEILVPLSRHPLPAEGSLQLEHLAVGAPPEIDDAQACAHTASADRTGGRGGATAAVRPTPSAAEPGASGELVDGDAEQHGDARWRGRSPR